MTRSVTRDPEPSGGATLPYIRRVSFNVAKFCAALKKAMTATISCHVGSNPSV